MNENYEEITNMIDKCTNINPKETPSILEIILEFYIYYKDHIRDANFSEKYSKHYQDIYDIQAIKSIKNIDSNNDMVMAKNIYKDC